jgi:pimeloyl-ACP methyl ester carboxylesterase
LSSEGKLRWLDKREFLASRDEAISMGSIVNTRSERFQTDFYHALNEPRRDGSIPWVNSNAHSVVIFLHGSGTKKASGKNFLHLMNQVHSAGVAPLSFDLPHHKNGPTEEAFDDAGYFMDWLHRIVQEVKSQARGKKIYFAGHSFGPDIAMEYLSRYDDVDGALLLSPGGDWHPALAWTYENITSKAMSLIGGKDGYIDENLKGGSWAFKVTRGFTWMKKATDPSNVWGTIGDLDEWFPGNEVLRRKVEGAPENPYAFDEPIDWLRKHYPNGHFIVVPGVGHYLFDAKTRGGKNLILETLFDMLDLPKDERSNRPPPRTVRQQIAMLYRHDRKSSWRGTSAISRLGRKVIFRSWHQIPWPRCRSWTGILLERPSSRRAVPASTDRSTVLLS